MPKIWVMVSWIYWDNVTRLMQWQIMRTPCGIHSHLHTRKVTRKRFGRRCITWSLIWIICCITVIKTEMCLPRSIITKLLKGRLWVWERFCILICYGCSDRYIKTTQLRNELLIGRSLIRNRRRCNLLTWWWIVLLLIWKELKFYWPI